MDQDLTERVARIEKRNRLLAIFLILTLAAFLIMLCYGLKKMPALKGERKLAVDSIRVNTLVAGSIEVVGSRGKNSISLGATDDGWAALSFRDLQGAQKAVILLTPSGKPSLTFFGDKTARISLGVVDLPASQGEEFSLQLKDPTNVVIWHPDVPNRY